MSKHHAIMLGMLTTGLSGISGAQHWGYSGEAGPENWSKVDAKNAMCAMGRNQSPIDLTAPIKAELAPLKLAYSTNSSDIVNNGHTVQVNYAAGSTLNVDGRAFELKQFHFHAPSENKVGGKQFPLEAHLVHADKDGNLAVVAVMFQEGAANALLTKLWESMPTKAGAKAALSGALNVSDLLPADRSYYRFNGSLTTPPCSEGVRWFVMKAPASVSKAQVAQFAKAVGFANNRPVQPLNAREVLQ
jgi:carbonic anhydrase